LAVSLLPSLIITDQPYRSFVLLSASRVLDALVRSRAPRAPDLAGFMVRPLAGFDQISPLEFRK
jgi:hypothetical protein